MEIPESAIVQERRNLYYIYLYYVEEQWWAFEYSAYYLTLMYPALKVVEHFSSAKGTGETPCVQLPDSYLLKISALHDVLVSDSYMQISAPPTAYCYRFAYDDWREKQKRI